MVTSKGSEGLKYDNMETTTKHTNIRTQNRSSLVSLFFTQNVSSLSLITAEKFIISIKTDVFLNSRKIQTDQIIHKAGALGQIKMRTRNPYILSFATKKVYYGLYIFHAHSRKYKSVFYIQPYWSCNGPNMFLFLIKNSNSKMLLLEYIEYIYQR